jgi:hypothetical protein
MKNKFTFKSIFATLLLIASATTTNSQTITTVCGTGTAGYGGDNGAATSAMIDANYGQLACDKFGNIYIADDFNHRVRKINVVTGSITTIAGTGLQGFAGDGGLATAAQLSNPDGVAVDNAGNVYIADYNNHRIRKIDPTGTITTICGNGTQSSTGDGSVSTAATIDGPGHICVDPTGNLYITEYNSNKVRKIAITGTITTFCGTGANSNTGDGGLATAATIANPWEIASDASGNIFVASYFGDYVRKIATNGTITAYAGQSGISGYGGDGGAATSASLNSVTGLAANDLGDVFIADSANHRIRKVIPTGTISTYAGTGAFGFSGDNGLSTAAQIYGPNGGMATFGCALYILDVGNARIRKVVAGVAPTLSLSSTAPATLCLGQSATLTASGANTYTWNTGATVNSISVNPTVTTNYTAVATTSNGCKGSNVITQIVATCAGIENLSANNANLIVYPNPADNYFTIEAQNATKVILTDVVGKVVMEMDLTSAKTTLSLAEFKNGIYILKVYEGSKLSATHKIVKD